MAALNTGSGVAARNGTTSHTISFGFTSTSGSLLVFCVAGAVTHAATGWTEQLSPVSNAELSVFTKTSAGDSSITVTHNGSNYPVAWYVWEWVTGTTWVNGTSATAQNDTMPALGSLGSDTKEVGAAVCVSVGASRTASSAVWGVLTEVLDSYTSGPTTEGIWLTVATGTTTATSITPTVTCTLTGSGDIDRQKVVWAVTEPAGGTPATVTPAAVAVVAALDTPVVSIPATVTPAEVGVIAASPQASVLAAATVAPTEVAAVAALPTATIDITAAATVTPATVTATVALDTPTVSIPATVTPAAVAATAALPTPTTDVSGVALVTPAAVDLILAFPGPTVAAGWVTTPATIGVVAGLPAATVTLATTSTPATVTVTTALPDPSYTAGATVTVAVIEVTTTIPTPSLDAVLAAFFYYEAQSGLVGAAESGGGLHGYTG